VQNQPVESASPDVSRNQSEAAQRVAWQPEAAEPPAVASLETDLACEQNPASSGPVQQLNLPQAAEQTAVVAH